MSLTTDFTLQIGDSGLIIGAGTDYLVTEVDGFGVPPVRNGDTPRPADRGSYFGRDFIGQRLVTLKVVVVGDDQSAALDNLDALFAAWQLDTPDGSAYMPLKFLVPGRDARRFHGRPRDAAVDETTVQGSQIPVTLLFATADPSIFADALSSDTVPLADVGSGRTYDLTFPRVYGAGSAGGIILAENAGNYPTRPVATIVGPCTNPTIENVDTGETMDFVISLTADDSFVVDFDARTIELNGQSRYSTKTTASTWWELAPGTTEVHFNANAFELGASLTLEWRSAWIQ